MTITHRKVKIWIARIYEPETLDWDRKPVPPKYQVSLRHTDNPDRAELSWRVSHHTGNAYCAYRSSIAPRITLRDPAFYPALIALHDVYRARNIPLDMMFNGAECDIVLNEYVKPDETVLQLSELIFDNMETFNHNGDKSL